MKKIIKKVILFAIMLSLAMIPKQVHAQDSITLFVERLYWICLNRQPDAAGLQFWTEQLRNQTMSGAMMAQEILFSEEFQNRNVTEREFIHLLYQAILGRTEDPNGMDYWLASYYNGMSMKYICHQFILSNEFKNICENYGVVQGSMELTDAVDQDISLSRYICKKFKQCFLRRPSEDDLEYWVMMIQSGQKKPRDVVCYFLTCDEFEQLDYSDEEYISIVYDILLETPCESDEMMQYVEQLEQGMNREDLVQELSLRIPPDALGTDTIGYIFVGDSRFYEMNQYFPIESIHPRYFQVSLGGAGYVWFLADGMNQILQIQEQHPEIKGWSIICGLGINDLPFIEEYIKIYQELLRRGYQLTLLSVNPVDEPNSICNNHDINQFNVALRRVQDSVYMDSYHYLLEQGYSTKDTIHYTPETYRNVLQFIRKHILF